MITISDSENILKKGTFFHLALKDYLTLLREAVSNDTVMAYRFADEDAATMNLPFLSAMLPQVCFQCQLRQDEEGNAVFDSYNGLIVISITGITSRHDMETTREKAQRIPQTAAVFAGADSHSLTILALAERPDGTLPQDASQAQAFHTAVYQLAVQTYSSVMDAAVDISFPDITRCIPLGADDSPYLAKNPVRFVLPQPVTPTVDSLEEVRTKNHKILQKKGWDYYFTITNVLNAMRRRAASVENVHKDDRGVHHLYLVAEMAAMAELPEEEVVNFLAVRYAHLTVKEIRDEVRTAYMEALSKKRYGICPPEAMLPKPQRIALQTEDFIARRYDIKHNDVTGNTEFRRRQSIDYKYCELTPSSLNTMCHEAALEGLEVTEVSMKRYINSQFIDHYNPITDFLDNLPQWDGTDRITALMQMVPTDNLNWVELGSRWFLSMVSHWINPLQQHANSTAPVLIGGQGLRKSTFCRNILPPSLLPFYTDAVDFRTDIEAERFLSRFLLINIDEFDQLSPGQFAYIKHMFQKTQTAHRQLFSEKISNHPRYASFIATSNCYDILKDPTGNRRFLCVEVKDVIDTETPIDYPQLYAQAVTQIDEGVRCWINDDDEALITGSNKTFEEVSPLEELFLSVFRKPEMGETSLLMRASDIMVELKKKPAFSLQKGSVQQLGHILTKNKFEMIRKTNGRYYRVIKN